MDRMVVAGAEDQVPCAGLGAVGDAHRGPGRDDAEADHDRSRLGPAVRPDHDLAREARRVRAAALTAAMGTPLGRGGCMCGADGYLVAKLVSSYSCPLTSGAWRRPWRWPGSSRRVLSQVTGSTRVPWSEVSLRCPAGRGAIAMDAGSTGLMGEDSRRRVGASGLTDRRGERSVLDQLIGVVRAGGSRVLVVRGEPGVGKSALMDYLAGHAPGCRVARATGVQSEMELAFAGLHQLL